MKILVAADGSPYTKHMLAYLAAHDEWLGAHHKYVVVTVVAPVPARAAAAVAREVLKSYYDDEGQKVLKPIRSFFAKQGIEAEFIARTGNAADVIVAIADKVKFDLLVLGSHGHGAIGNLLLGSVATKVLSRTKTPLLLIR